MTNLTITFQTNEFGKIVSAESDLFRAFLSQDMYVFDKTAGMSIYLPTGGYPLPEGGFGSQPAPQDVVAAARAFSRAVDEEIARRAAEAKAARAAAEDAAFAVIEAIPAEASKELAAVNTRARQTAHRENEGGEGYVHVYGWDSRIGREIASRHGLDVDRVTAAFAVIAG